MLIGQPLSNDALERFGGPLVIRDLAGVVAEIELAEIALKVLRADVLVDASEPALENREVVFDHLGSGIAAHIFVD